MQITGILTALVTALTALAAFLGAFNAAIVPITPTFGAVGNLNSPLEIYGVHDITKEILDHETFRTGTTTVCSFKTPNATTTGFIAAQAVSVPFAQSFQMSNAATQWATTTDLGSFTTAAGVATVESVYNPNTFISVSAATSSGTIVNANFNPKGTCSISLTVI